jgi:hypothetical protein
LAHDAAIVLEQLLDPLEAQQEAVVAYSMNFLMDFLENLKVKSIDAFQKRKIFVVITSLLHFLCEKSIYLLQPFEPVLITLFSQTLFQPFEVACKMLIFVFSEKLPAALGLEDLTEEVDYYPLIHSFYNRLHYFRLGLVEIHQLDRPLVAKRPNQPTQVAIGSFLRLLFENGDMYVAE